MSTEHMKIDVYARTDERKSQTFLELSTNGSSEILRNFEEIDYNYNGLKIRLNFFDGTSPIIREKIVRADLTNFFIAGFAISIFFNIILLLRG